MDDFKEMYSKFFIKNHRYWECNTEQTEEIFKTIYTAECITRMVVFINKDKPAVFGVSYILEKYYGDIKPNKQWQLACKAWIDYILKDFGYVKTYSRKIVGGRYFTSGHCYIDGGTRKKELAGGYQIKEVER